MIADKKERTVKSDEKKPSFCYKCMIKRYFTYVKTKLCISYWSCETCGEIHTGEGP